MAKKEIEYEGKVYLEGGCCFHFGACVEDEDDVPKWMKDLHSGKLPSGKIFYLGKIKDPKRVYVVTDKIVAFEIYRRKTEIS